MRGRGSGLRRSEAWNGFFKRAPGSRQRNGKAISTTTHEAIENPLGECSLITEDERIPTARMPLSLANPMHMMVNATDPSSDIHLLYPSNDFPQAFRGLCI